MTNKELFKQFSSRHKDLLPFSLQYKWWDEVVMDNWEVAIVADNNTVKAVWPYYIRKKGLWKFIANPPFTPYTGPFLIYPEGQKKDSKISFENKVHKDLISQLPNFSELSQNFNLGFSNSLAFLWNGFSDEKRFTYLLELNESEEVIWNGFRENTRRQIRKAGKDLTVVDQSNASLLERLLKETYQNQEDSYPNFSPSLFSRIIEYVKTKDAGKMLVAQDKKGNIHSAILMVFDKLSAYYLIGGSAIEHKNSGAMSLLMWEAIKSAKAAGKQYFNFEGSSIEAIEKYLRGFGGELTTFSRISKMNSSTLETLKKIK